MNSIYSWIDVIFGDSIDMPNEMPPPPSKEQMKKLNEEMLTIGHLITDRQRFAFLNRIICLFKKHDLQFARVFNESGSKQKFNVIRCRRCTTIMPFFVLR